jgi:hypothetical protein
MYCSDSRLIYWKKKTENIYYGQVSWSYGRISNPEFYGEQAGVLKTQLQNSAYVCDVTAGIKKWRLVIRIEVDSEQCKEKFSNRIFADSLFYIDFQSLVTRLFSLS